MYVWQTSKGFDSIRGYNGSRYVVKGRLFSLPTSVVTGLIIIVGAISPVAATTSSPVSGGTGLKVSPVISNLVINAGKSQTVVVSVQNVTKTSVSLQVLVTEFA